MKRATPVHDPSRSSPPDEHGVFASNDERLEVEGLLRKLGDVEDGTLGAARLRLHLARYGMIDARLNLSTFEPEFDAYLRNSAKLGNADVAMVRRLFTAHAARDQQTPGHLTRALADGQILSLFQRLADLLFAAHVRRSGAVVRANAEDAQGRPRKARRSKPLAAPDADESNALPAEARVNHDPSPRSSVMAPRSSATVPIEVAWVSRDLSRIGLTYAPGKKGPSRNGPAWDRSLTDDLQRLVHEHGVDRMFVLLEPQELDILGIPSLVADATARGLRTTHFPVEQGAIPASVEAAAPIVEEACEAATLGSRVLFVARSLGGRASMLAACTLVSLGFSPEDAFAMLARELGGYVFDSDDQRAFVRRYARWSLESRR